MNIVQVYKRFPTATSCLKHIEKVRWNGKPCCPYCSSTNSTPLKKEQRHHCNNCNTSYSVTVKTIFHHTHIDLQKWFLAISLMLNAKKDISVRQLARDIEVNKNTAWLMAIRIRNALIDQRDLLTGIVEMDETYIGGKPRKGKNKRGRRTLKAPVVGMLQRGFSAFLKRSITGQYHKVSLKYLPKYIDEFWYRYNNQKNDQAFDLILFRSLSPLSDV